MTNESGNFSNCGILGFINLNTLEIAQSRNNAINPCAFWRENHEFTYWLVPHRLQYPNFVGRKTEMNQTLTVCLLREACNVQIKLN